MIKGFSSREAKSLVSNKSRNNEDTPDLKEAHFDFSLSGSFEEFMSFFDSIEKNIPLIDVESLNITREKTKDEENEEESGGKNMLDCEVVFSLYHL